MFNARAYRHGKSIRYSSTCRCWWHERNRLDIGAIEVHRNDEIHVGLDPCETACSEVFCVNKQTICSGRLHSI